MYENLDTLFPEVVASGIYYAYLESSALTQLLVIGNVQAFTHAELASIFRIGPNRIQRRLSGFRKRVRSRVPHTPSGWFI